MAGEPGRQVELAYAQYAVITDRLRNVDDGKITVEFDPGCAGFQGLEGVYEAQAHIRTGQNTGKVPVSL